MICKDDINIGKRCNARRSASGQLCLVNHQKGRTGLPQDGLADTDFLNVKIQQVAFVVQSRAADNGQIKLELSDCFSRKVSDKTAV